MPSREYSITIWCPFRANYVSSSSQIITQLIVCDTQNISIDKNENLVHNKQLKWNAMIKVVKKVRENLYGIFF